MVEGSTRSCVAVRHIYLLENIVGDRPVLSSGAERVVFVRLAQFLEEWGGQTRLLPFEALGHPTHELGKR